jgi:DNA-binding NarL/FixJ family response regulator
MHIVVAGPHPAVRRGVTLLLSDIDGWSIVEGPDVDTPRGRSALRDADLLVLDLDPFVTRLPLLRRVAMAGTPVVALLTTASAAHRASVLAHGAAVCLSKDECADQLIPAIRHVTQSAA